MSPKGSIAKKVPCGKYNQIPFLDRPLQNILSILRYMKTTREEKEDTETGMYYTSKSEYPYDLLSQKQMDVYGFTFSKQSNVDALHKISPIYISKPNIVLPENYKNVEEQQTYYKPIGPTSFLRNTVPQAPDPTFVNFLQACSK
jgi:hypothetical protein